ncbi:MAG: DUF5777 family beta-barrel protein [Saprospiraceae bacterium]|nr:DUF5777 family beta-barrel protein [Saprospiraceae bacterium]MDW8483488.1 DUF5777 family beta-barrel protein [Saprospiraceae bacterium]
MNAFPLRLSYAIICSGLLWWNNVSKLFAQKDDLLSLLEEEEEIEYTTASFKTTRVVNGHSIENTAAGVLDFKIFHRFSPLNQGLYDAFGLDGATIRVGLDYGISDRLMVGIGRNSKEKIYDGFLKYKILRQSTGKRNMPISLSAVVDAQIRTIRFANPERDNRFSSRLYYTFQVLLARKFNDYLTLQLMPTLVHRNLVATRAEKNDVYSIGLAGRIRLTRRVTLNAEYYYVFPNQLAPQYVNVLSVGFDVETGGHVFQLHFTNSADMTYKGFITETTDRWFGTPSGIRFGFNISRVFTVIKPPEFRKN